MRRGATKVPKSNSMNEARMSEIPRQIGPKRCFELLYITATGAMCRANTCGRPRNCLHARHPHGTASVPLGDLRDGPRSPNTEAMAALG